MGIDTALVTLSNISFVSRVKRSNLGKGVAPSRHLASVAIEKGAFWTPSTTVTNFTYILQWVSLYKHIYKHLHSGRIWHKVNF